MDAVGVARQFKCGDEAVDSNWIIRIEEVRFQIQLDRLHHLFNID